VLLRLDLTFCLDYGQQLGAVIGDACQSITYGVIGGIGLLEGGGNSVPLFGHAALVEIDELIPAETSEIGSLQQSADISGDGYQASSGGCIQFTSHQGRRTRSEISVYCRPVSADQT